MATESRTSVRKLKGVEREQEAMRLRLEGNTYDQIASAMGISKGGVYSAVIRALRKLNERTLEDAEEVRRLELERLDALLCALWPKAGTGNFAAIDRVLKVMERRAKLLGLDAPVRQDFTSGGEPLDFEAWKRARAERLAAVEQMGDRECAPTDA